MESDHETPIAEKRMHEGYHGWMKTIVKTSQDFTPLRIENVAKLASGASVAQGKSAWNSAGTWEEIDKSSWARDRLRQSLLASFQFHDSERNVSVRINSVKKCDGEAKIIYSRGVKRCGYDISIKLEWSSIQNKDDVNQAKGYVEIHDFDDMNAEDYEIRVMTEESTSLAQDSKRAIIGWEQNIRDILTKWKQELLQQ